MQNWERSQQVARDRRIKENNKTIDEQLYHQLQVIESDQELLHRDVTKLYDLLGSYPSLEKRWNEFQKAGGISAQEFYRFIRNRFAPRKVRMKNHLRLLVSNSKSKSLPRHRLTDPEPEPPCRVKISRRR
jgi:hypothetical protein